MGNILSTELLTVHSTIMKYWSLGVIKYSVIPFLDEYPYGDIFYIYGITCFNGPLAAAAVVLKTK